MEIRKRKVLEAVVNDYVVTAEPVGSRSIARRYNLGVSPATIRNEMADLEDLGYLEQPHLSAGRVPSDKGYRYYVDNLVRPAVAGGEEYRGFMRNVLETQGHDMAGLLQHVARTLSEFVDYLVLISGPEMGSSAYRLVRFIPVYDGRVILFLVTEGGFVQTFALDIGDIVQQDMDKVKEAFYTSFYGMTLEDICNELYDTPPKGLEEYRAPLISSLNALVERLNDGQKQRVFFCGTANILKQPEFRDADKAFALFNALERHSLAYEMLQALCRDEEVDVAIGDEINRQGIQDCSLVVSAYRFGNDLMGRIGVLGPRRMDYARVMPLVREVSRTMTDVLNGL